MKQFVTEESFWELFPEAQIGIVAVSYTHLDVYKRQAESSVQLQVLCGEETEISRQPERAKRYEELRGAPELKERRISWPDCLELMACAALQMWS